MRNNPSSLTRSLEQDEYVFITKHGKPIGVAVPLTDENLQIGLTKATALQAWRNGDISLGKMAELLKMDKGDLMCLWGFPVTDGNGYYLVYPQRDNAPGSAVMAVQQWLREALYDTC